MRQAPFLHIPVMAAALLEIKSKLLLPRPQNGNDEAEPDPREVLVQRLLEFQFR